MRNLTVRQHTRIHTGFMIAAVILALISYAYSKPLQPHFTLWLAVGCVVISIVYRLIYIKCPHGGDKLLGSRVIPKHCPDTNPNEGE